MRTEAEGMEARLAALQNEIRACRRCADRFGFEPHPVLLGNHRARVLQISQAPSSTVHRTLRPFDDASGRKLRHEWYRIDDETFYNPDLFYITAIARCYPGRAKSGGDRPPPVACARLWLQRELTLVDSRIVIAIGGHAAAFLFPGRRFTDLVFEEHTMQGKPAFVLPHPSPLNIRWFGENPRFLSDCVPRMREALHAALFS